MSDSKHTQNALVAALENAMYWVNQLSSGRPIKASTMQSINGDMAMAAAALALAEGAPITCKHCGGRKDAIQSLARSLEIARANAKYWKEDYFKLLAQLQAQAFAKGCTK